MRGVAAVWLASGAMRIAELWRYPVKSLQGEQLESVLVTPQGFEGDRRYAIYDVETGFGLTARRVPELLFASARLLDGGELEIVLPDRSVVLDVGKHIERCVMTTRPQPGGIERDLDVLRTIARERGARLAVGALVARPGIVSVGDELRSSAPTPTRATA